MSVSRRLVAAGNSDSGQHKPKCIEVIVSGAGVELGRGSGQLPTVNCSLLEFFF